MLVTVTGSYSRYRQPGWIGTEGVNRDSGLEPGETLKQNVSPGPSPASQFSPDPSRFTVTLCPPVRYIHSIFTPSLLFHTIPSSFPFLFLALFSRFIVFLIFSIVTECSDGTEFQHAGDAVFDAANHGESLDDAEYDECSLHASHDAVYVSQSRFGEQFTTTESALRGQSAARKPDCSGEG